MTSLSLSRVSTPRWQSYARPIVRVRHPLLIAAVLLTTWRQRTSADWGPLSIGAHSLFSASPLNTYAAHPGLDAGPPGLAFVRLFDVLPGGSALAAAQLTLAILGWYLLYAAERWSIPGSRFGAAPLIPGLSTLLVGVPVLTAWAALAGGTPHIEDGLALLGFLLAARAVSQGRTLPAALLVGFAAACKPWAIVALPLLWGWPKKTRAVLVAVAIPAICWLPFVAGNYSTLSAVSHGLPLQSISVLHALGMHSTYVPTWWRTVELTGSLGLAGLAAWRRDWRVAFAAGLTARLLLDPAGYDYYFSGLIIATAVTERLAGLLPWRTLLLLAALVSAPSVVPTAHLAQLRLVVLGLVALSYVVPSRRSAPGGPLGRLKAGYLSEDA